MTLRQRLRRFVSLGIVLGATLALAAVVGVPLMARLRSVPQVTPLKVAALYVVAGCLGGLVVALAFPLTKRLSGAFTVGAMGVFPVYFGVAVILEPARWATNLAIGAGLATFVGGIVGATVWLDEHPDFPLSRIWLFAAGASVIAWIIGLRWAGQWPSYLATLLFLVPVGLAVFATVGRGRSRTTPPN